MKKFVTGAVIGAAISGVVVALTTPKKGAELREDVKHGADKVKEQGEVVIEKAKEGYEHASHKVVETAETVKSKIKHTEETEGEE